MIQDVKKFWLPFVPAIVVGIGKGDFTGAPHQVLQVLHQTKQVLMKSGRQQKQNMKLSNPTPNKADFTLIYNRRKKNYEVVFKMWSGNLNTEHLNISKIKIGT